MITNLFSRTALHQHADPAQRVLGLAALAPDAGELAQLLAADPAPEVRSAAARRCTDLAALAAAWDRETDAAVRLAEAQEQWACLAAEAKRLSRRVNALDTLLIPRLEAERDHIELALDERERSARFQLKLVQRRLALVREP